MLVGDHPRGYQPGTLGAASTQAPKTFPLPAPMLAAVIAMALALAGCQALQTGVPQMEPPNAEQVEQEQRKLDLLTEP